MTQIFRIYNINGLPDTNFTNGTYDPTGYTHNISMLYKGTDQYIEQCTNQIDANTSSIYITSDPIDAQIFIDNIEQTGFRTPSMITDIPSGNHNIKLMSPGYTDIESSIPLESGRTYNIFLTMEKLQEQISIDSSGIILLLAIGLGFLLIKNR